MKEQNKPLTELIPPDRGSVVIFDQNGEPICVTHDGSFDYASGNNAPRPNATKQSPPAKS